MPEDPTRPDAMIRDYDVAVPMRDGVTLRVDVHKVFHNAEYPSHLLLPVVPPGEGSPDGAGSGGRPWGTVS